MRIFELRISKKHQREITSRGGAKAKDPSFPVHGHVSHPGHWIGRPPKSYSCIAHSYRALAIPMLALFVAANIVRWW